MLVSRFRNAAVLLACVVMLNGCVVLNHLHCRIGSGAIYYGQKTTGLLYYWWSACGKNRACLAGILNNPNYWHGDSGLDYLKLGANYDYNFFASLNSIGTTNTNRCLVFYASSIGAGFTTVPNGGFCEPLQNPAQ